MRRIAATMMMSLLGGALMFGAVASAQGGAPVLEPALHAGTCTEPGEQVAQLDTFQPESGPWIGVEGLGIVLESDTDDVQGGQMLTDSPHVIAVFDGETMVACGEIGGLLDDDDLHIGLLPVDGSGYFGIADIDDLDDDDDDIDIDIHLYQPAA